VQNVSTEMTSIPSFMKIRPVVQNLLGGRQEHNNIGIFPYNVNKVLMKLTVTQLVKKVTDLYVARRFITVFTRARQFHGPV
jgi:hypothetical protein